LEKYVNTAEFEQRLGSAPRAIERKAEAKALQQSGVCADAELRLARALKFEQHLTAAFDIDMPADLAASLLVIAGPALVPSVQPAAKANQRRVRHAAGVAIFAVAAFMANQGQMHPQNALLAQHCSEHMTHEPFALSRRTVVPKALVERMFAMNGFATQMPDGRNLTDALGEVNYLSPCTLDGKVAIHMVVQTGSGPVTVMVMPNMTNDGASEERINGALVRVSPLSKVSTQGAMVLVAESGVSVDAVEARFLKAFSVV
jgi:hypothetical protein